MKTKEELIAHFTTPKATTVAEPEHGALQAIFSDEQRLVDPAELAKAKKVIEGLVWEEVAAALNRLCFDSSLGTRTADLKKIADYYNRYVKEPDAEELSTDSGLTRSEQLDIAHQLMIQPSYYGSIDDVYEIMKVIEALGLNFKLGNVLKCIARAGKKGSRLEDLLKAQEYLRREIELEQLSTNKQ